MFASAHVIRKVALWVGPIRRLYDHATRLAERVQQLEAAIGEISRERDAALANARAEREAAREERDRLVQAAVSVARSGGNRDGESVVELFRASMVHTPHDLQLYVLRADLERLTLVADRQRSDLREARKRIDAMTAELGQLRPVRPSDDGVARLHRRGGESRAV